jgi:hypothetical protein
MATAFLTGIVAETQRFSNTKTSPKVMTMAAQLMAAGANQQLIATKLEPPKLAAPPAPPKPAPLPPAPPKPATPPPIGVLNIPHGPEGEQKDGEVSVDPNEIHIDEQGNLKTAQDILAEEERKKEEEKQKEEQPPPPEETPFVPKEPEKKEAPEEEPEPHAFMGSKPMSESAFTATTEAEGPDLYNTVPIDPLTEPQESGLSNHMAVIQPPKDDDQSSAGPADADSARSAVENALDSVPFNPGFEPPVESLNAEPAMDVHPDESQPKETPHKMNNGRNGDTPSLQLPTNGHADASSPPDNGQTSPPPMPPPLMPFGAPSN